jgi:hypothetical protein
VNADAGDQPGQVTDHIEKGLARGWFEDGERGDNGLTRRRAVAYGIVKGNRLLTAGLEGGLQVHRILEPGRCPIQFGQIIRAEVQRGGIGRQRGVEMLEQGQLTLIHTRDDR